MSYNELQKRLKQSENKQNRVQNQSKPKHIRAFASWPIGIHILGNEFQTWTLFYSEYYHHNEFQINETKIFHKIFFLKAELKRFLSGKNVDIDSLIFESAPLRWLKVGDVYDFTSKSEYTINYSL